MALAESLAADRRTVAPWTETASDAGLSMTANPLEAGLSSGRLRLRNCQMALAPLTPHGTGTTLRVPARGVGGVMGPTQDVRHQPAGNVCFKCLAKYAYTL